MTTRAVWSNEKCWRRMLEAMVRVFANDHGQDLIEYALLCGFVTLGVILAATSVGQTVNAIYSGVGTGVASIPSP